MYIIHISTCIMDSMFMHMYTVQCTVYMLITQSVPHTNFMYLGASDKNLTVDKLRGDLKDKPRKESILETQDEH